MDLQHKNRNARLPRPAPRRIRLGSDRTLVLDLLHFARQVPVFPVERAFDLTELAARRAATQPHIAWSILFLKAYAIVSARRPALRQAFVTWPWPHLVEWPYNHGMVAVSRTHQGRERLCWAGFQYPEKRTLAELHGHLRWYQSKPVEEAFPGQVYFSRLPTSLRRWAWWWILNVASTKRPSRVGTFGISSLAGQHSLNRGHPSMLTTSVTYGPLDERGRSIVTLLCDHRVLDGVEAAAALNDLEDTLQGAICRELELLTARKAA